MNEKTIKRFVLAGLMLFLVTFVGWFLYQARPGQQVMGDLPTFTWSVPKESPEINFGRVWTETRTGDSFTDEDSDAKAAYRQLQEQKKDLKEQSVLAALDLVDAVYINPSKMTELIKANSRKNEEDLYKNLWHHLANHYTDAKLQEDYILEFQGKAYPIDQFAPMTLKINTNALQQAKAYELKGYHLKGDRVILKLGVRKVDEFQYYAQASYLPNFSSFIEPLALLSNESPKEGDVSQRVAARFLYYLAAVNFAEDGYVDLYGMSYGVLKDIYVEMTYKNGQIQIDDQNLARLFQANLGEEETGLETFFPENEKS